ncbi:unnamed protein product [Phyllotreta striolata]|uniref:Nicotinamide riboside kinase 1 n=1 Tax=Phyllotreta striolata TaxID=444603 RepID=A0A9N9TWZ7_PHYSR|nr:unnamed protein product [Phyllotreta striolata]
MSDKREAALVVVGISGVTCGGKTTTAQKLHKIFPNCKIITQDDYYLDDDDPRHTWIPELNHANYDILTSLDMSKMHQDVLNILNNESLVRINHNNYKKSEENITNISRKLRTANLKLLLIEGFSIFNYEPLLPVFDLKYYFTLNKEECFDRRKGRVYDPPDVPGYFERCAWPEHLQQLKEVESKVDNVRYFSGTADPEQVLETIVKDIYALYDQS